MFDVEIVVVIVKIIYDELVGLLGSENASLNLSGSPACVLMCGLHGSGKTTTSGKLAKLLAKQGRAPLLVAADVYRPAAMDQLATLGKQIDVPVFVKKGETDVLKIAREALAFAAENQRATLIFDTVPRSSRGVGRDAICRSTGWPGAINPP